MSVASGLFIASSFPIHIAVFKLSFRYAGKEAIKICNRQLACFMFLNCSHRYATGTAQGSVSLLFLGKSKISKNLFILPTFSAAGSSATLLRTAFIDLILTATSDHLSRSFEIIIYANDDPTAVADRFVFFFAISLQ